jgi:iron complex outermembrane receptor protein
MDKEWDTRAELTFGAMGPLSASALGDDSSYLFPPTTKSAAAFFFTELPVSEQLRLQAGARVGDVKVRGTPSTDVPTERAGTNLLNRNERNSVAFNKDVVLLAGRDVQALLRLSF